MIDDLSSQIKSCCVPFRCVTENHPHNPEPEAAKAATAEGGVEPAIAQSEPPRKNLPTMESPKPQPRPSVRPPQPQVKNPAGRPDTAPTSPDIVHRVKNSPVNMQPCQHSAALPHHPSPPLTPTHGRDSPTVAKVSPRSRENSPALQKRIVPWCGDGPAPMASSTETTSQPPGSEESHTNRGSIKHIVKDVEVVVVSLIILVIILLSVKTHGSVSCLSLNREK